MHFIHEASVTNNLIYNPEAAVMPDFSLHEYLSNELACFCPTEMTVLTDILLKMYLDTKWPF